MKSIGWPSRARTVIGQALQGGFSRFHITTLMRLERYSNNLIILKLILSQPNYFLVAETF
jgi:hypothetical protein